MYKVLLILSLLFVLGCQPSQDNKDGADDNFKFSSDQLGQITFNADSINFGATVLGNQKVRIIEIKNVGKFPVRDFKTLFNGEEFNIDFRYSGEEGVFPGEQGTCSTQLESGESCTLSYTFLPLAQGTKTVEVEITYANGLNLSKGKITFNGYGGAEANINLSQSLIDFGFMDQSEVVRRELVVTNIGQQVAREINFVFNQSQDSLGRDLYSINSNLSTCSMSDESLAINESCKIIFEFNSNFDQDYQTYIANLQMTYKYDPDSQEIETEEIDLQALVVSIEGVLTVPTAPINFGDFVNGAIASRNITIRNTGFNNLSIDNVHIFNSESAVSVNTSDCLNIDDDIFDNIGRLTITPSSICVLEVLFTPNIALLPGDFSTSQINFSYENYKTGIVTSDSFSVDANIKSPANITIQGALTPNNEILNITDVFISNNADFTQEFTYILENTGEVAATSINFNYTPSPYIEQVNDCSPIMATGDTCQVTFTMNPVYSVYNQTGSLDLTSNLNVNYNNQTDVSLGQKYVSTTSIATTGTIHLRSDLIFSNSLETANIRGVPGSSSFFTVQVQNQGGVPETNFNLVISDTIRYFVLSGVGYTTVNGEQNCADIDNGQGTLAIDATCSYALRVFETVAGNYSADLALNFNSSLNQSDTVTANATFGDPGKIELRNPNEEDKIAVRSYASFNYPGVGSSTPVNDVALERFVSNSNLALPQSMMTFPTPPVSMTIDFALIEAGYYPISTTSQVQLDFSNTGGFEIELRNFQLVEVRNETLDSTLPLDGQILGISNNQGLDCYNNSNVDVINAPGNCKMRFNFTPAGSYTYSGIARIDYTLGERISATSEELVVYTSYINFLAAGYDPSSVADIEPVTPVSISSDGEVIFNVVHGVLDSQTQDVTFQNIGSGLATNLQIAIEGSASLWTTTTGAPLVVSDVTQLTAPLDSYYEIDNSSCAVGTPGQIASGESCVLSSTFTPTTLNDIELTVHYRFFNGITYERDSYTMLANSNTPANIFIRGADGSSPLYTYDFGIKVVESTTVQKIEFVNQGESTATNILSNNSSSDFTFTSSIDPQFPGCGSDLNAGESCYFDLSFTPLNAGVETNLQGMFNITFNNGLNPILAGGSEIQAFAVRADGFSEEKYSLHQGWTQIESYGENATYAATQVGVASTDVGYVKFAWNLMLDDGVITNPIDRYIIFKNQTNVFDIHNDTPYAFVTPIFGENEVEFIDNSLANVPGSVWFYYVIAERNGKKSKVDIEESNIATIRIAIPYNYSSLLHKYQAAMDQCRLMNLDVNDVNNINLENNGCKYLDQNLQTLTYAPQEDLHIDKYEATLTYSQTAVSSNTPGGRVIQETYDNGLNACSAKLISFNTTAPGLTQNIAKTFMNKQEHFIISQPLASAPYVTTDCQTNDFERVSGSGEGKCESKYQIEYAVGGYPEWTSTGISGFGVGNSTADVTNGVDFSESFNNITLGLNQRNYVTSNQNITELCMDVRFGNPVRKIVGQCLGDNLKNIVFTSGSSPEAEVNISGIASDSRLLIVYFNQDISDQGVEIKALAGGGDVLDIGMQNNYSPYTSEFYTTNYPFGTYRCVARLPYGE